MHTPSNQLPLLVRVGFAGSRLLYGSGRLPPAACAAADEQLLPQLIARLDALPPGPALAPQQVLCGVSQMAIGADMLFARALQARALPHHVLLPQAPQAYFSAGELDAPDFTAEEEAAARRQIAAPQVIEVRVVSDAAERAQRFQDTNDEILRVSDVIVCLTREGASARPGGTRDLMARTERAGKPLLLLEVAMVDAQPVLSSWLLPTTASTFSAGP
jgi:hypothetical protein